MLLHTDSRRRRRGLDEGCDVVPAIIASIWRPPPQEVVHRHVGLRRPSELIHRVRPCRIPMKRRELSVAGKKPGDAPTRSTEIGCVFERTSRTASLRVPLCRRHDRVAPCNECEVCWALRAALVKRFRTAAGRTHQSGSPRASLPDSRQLDGGFADDRDLHAIFTARRLVDDRLEVLDRGSGPVHVARSSRHADSRDSRPSRVVLVALARPVTLRGSAPTNAPAGVKIVRDRGRWLRASVKASRERTAERR